MCPLEFPEPTAPATSDAAVGNSQPVWQRCSWCRSQGLMRPDLAGATCATSPKGLSRPRLRRDSPRAAHGARPTADYYHGLVSVGANVPPPASVGHRKQPCPIGSPPPCGAPGPLWARFESFRRLTRVGACFRVALASCGNRQYFPERVNAR